MLLTTFNIYKLPVIALATDMIVHWSINNLLFFNTKLSVDDSLVKNGSYVLIFKRTAHNCISLWCYRELQYLLKRLHEMNKLPLFNVYIYIYIYIYIYS